MVPACVARGIGSLPSLAHRASAARRADSLRASFDICFALAFPPIAAASDEPNSASDISMLLFMVSAIYAFLARMSNALLGTHKISLALCVQGTHNAGHEQARHRQACPNP